MLSNGVKHIRRHVISLYTYVKLSVEQGRSGPHSALHPREELTLREASTFLFGKRDRKTLSEVGTFYLRISNKKRKAREKDTDGIPVQEI